MLRCSLLMVDSTISDDVRAPQKSSSERTGGIYLVTFFTSEYHI